MYKRIVIICILVFLSPFIYSNPQVYQSYIHRFISADLSGKAEILREASSNTALGGFSGQLYEYALQFVLNNYKQMDNIRGMNSIVNISVNALRVTGRVENMDVLWRLFLEYPDAQVNAEILVTMGIVGKGNRSLVNSINLFLTERSLSFRLGETVDYVSVSACISAVMELDDSSSYPALFAVICAGFPEVITSEAYGAFEMINGNLHQFLFNVIVNNPPEEKFAAFRAGVNSGRLTVSQRGQLAELALEQAFAASLIDGEEEEDSNINAMRYASVLALTSLRWTRANALAIRHYYRVLADYNHEAVPKDRLIEAIACLGAVGNSDAALTLGLQLGLINAKTESLGSYDEEITLAIVRALGTIGYKAAYDHLLDVENLPYSEDIQEVAREAIDRLKW